MTMFAVRLADETIEQIDLLVAGGWTVNRTAFVREAIDSALARSVEAAIDRQIVTALDQVEELPEQVAALRSSTRRWLSSLPDEDW